MIRGFGKSGNFTRECGIVLSNDLLIDVQKGTSGGVNADFFNVWNYWKKHNTDSLILIHTHPDNCRSLSHTDHEMLKGWCKTFPVPIISAIVYNEIINTGGLIIKSTNSTVYMSHDFCGKYRCVKLGDISNMGETMLQLLTSASSGNEDDFNILKSSIYKLEYSMTIRFNTITELK